MYYFGVPNRDPDLENYPNLLEFGREPLRRGPSLNCILWPCRGVQERHVFDTANPQHVLESRMIFFVLGALSSMTG